MRNRFKRLFVLVPFVFLGACGGKTILIDRDGRESTGTYDAIGKTLDVTVNGKLYRGSYITNAGTGVGSFQTYGAKPTYGTTQTYASGSSGRAILRSQDGETIQCEFNYQGMNAIGTCGDAKGNTWQLMAGQ